jgi:hypothetical protein
MALLYNQRNDEFSIDEAFVDDDFAPPPPQPQDRPASSGGLAAKSSFFPVTAHPPKGNSARVTKKKNQETNEDVEVALPSTRTDPFATREGKTLTWTNVNMTLVGKGGVPDRHLLQDVWGEVPVNKTTAIMGPSGAGYVCDCR